MAKNFEDYRNEALKVYCGMITVYPQNKRKERINITDEVMRYENCFSINNSSVAFVYGGEFYVHPYTNGLIDSLESEKLKKAEFDVPFSKWDYPESESEKWFGLLKQARKEHEDEFRCSCIDYCLNQGVTNLQEETLSKCFEMPDEGVHVQHVYFSDCYFPVMNEKFLWEGNKGKLGKYCTNNGVLVFVHTDGRTFATRNLKILEELEKNGYRESELLVPFSRGEMIKDPFLRNRWENLK